MIALLLLACRPPPAIEDVVVQPDERIPTVLHVSWSFDGEGEHQVEVDGEPTPSSPTSEVDVLGLAASETYTLRPVVVLPDGERVEGDPIEVTIADPPPALPPIEVTVSDDAAMDPGRYVLLTIGTTPRNLVAILDREGRWVWWHVLEPDIHATTAKPSRDGRDILAVVNQQGDVDAGAILRLPLRGGPIEQTRALLAHHDFAELPDGQLAWLSEAVRDVDVDGQVLPLRGDRILRAPAGATSDDEAVVVFDVFDDLGREPFLPCEHAERPSDSPLGRSHEFTHGNSLIASPDGATLYYNARYLDALFALDAASGEVRWQLGGLDNDFALPPGLELWTHGHLSQVDSDGMVMFDNADHDVPQVSGFVAYAFDEQAKTVDEVFRYDSPDGWAVNALGDARRLASGTFMVTWGRKAAIQEITPAGAVIWQGIAPDQTLLSRFTVYSDLYDLGYSAR